MDGLFCKLLMSKGRKRWGSPQGHRPIRGPGWIAKSLRGFRLEILILDSLCFQILVTVCSIERSTTVVYWPVAYLRHIADVILLLGLEVDVAGVQLRHAHHGAQQSRLAATTGPQQSVAATTEYTVTPSL